MVCFLNFKACSYPKSHDFKANGKSVHKWLSHFATSCILFILHGIIVKMPGFRNLKSRTKNKHVQWKRSGLQYIYTFHIRPHFCQCFGDWMFFIIGLQRLPVSVRLIVNFRKHELGLKTCFISWVELLW